MSKKVKTVTTVRTVAENSIAEAKAMVSTVLVKVRPLSFNTMVVTNSLLFMDGFGRELGCLTVFRVEMNGSEVVRSEILF